MNTNSEFQMVCANCGSLTIKIENPVVASSETVVICGDCGSSRGTMGALRDLATRSDVQEPSADRRAARVKSGSELVAMHRELQRLRRQIQIEESMTRAES
jgi:hypothetical protein